MTGVDGGLDRKSLGQKVIVKAASERSRTEQDGWETWKEKDIDCFTGHGGGRLVIR